jgi:hypothetical protein
MHPFLVNEVLLADLARERDRNLERLRHVREATVQAVPRDPVTLRLTRVGDEAQLERLATLESRRPSAGTHVVAEVEGTIIAALPLAGGKPYADPFRRTAHLLPLLELRARQVTDGVAPPRRPARRMFRALRWS